MKCPRCQHENPSGVKFCGECGARLESLCPSCRASNPPANKFCNECGAPLAQAATAAKFFSPESYTPKHLAEKILTSAFEGEIASHEDSVDVDGAVAHYQQAMALAEELRMRPLLAHCHAGLGKLHGKTANPQQAKAHLSTGVAMMREMEQGMWLERAEAELKGLG